MIDFVNEFLELNSLNEVRKAADFEFTVKDPNSPFFGKSYDDDEDEEDIYTAYDLLQDRLFGFGFNKSNFRGKWKFAEIEPSIKTTNGKIKRSYFYPTTHVDTTEVDPTDRRADVGFDKIGVFVYDEDEAQLAKKCAEELNLRFELRKNGKYSTKDYPYIAIIFINDDVTDLPLEDYVKKIGKKMSDFTRGKGEIKSDFKDHANYAKKIDNSLDNTNFDEEFDYSSDADYELFNKISSEIFTKLIELCHRYERYNLDVDDILACAEQACLYLKDEQ